MSNVQHNTCFYIFTDRFKNIMDDKLQRILSRTTLYPEKNEKLPEYGIIKLPDHYEEVR